MIFNENIYSFVTKIIMRFYLFNLLCVLWNQFLPVVLVAVKCNLD